MIRTLSLAVVLCCLAGAALAAPPGPPIGTPEIDASSGAQAIALIAAAVMMKVGRKK